MVFSKKVISIYSIPYMRTADFLRGDYDVAKAAKSSAVLKSVWNIHVAAHKDYFSETKLLSGRTWIFNEPAFDSWKTIDWYHQLEVASKMLDGEYTRQMHRNLSDKLSGKQFGYGYKCWDFFRSHSIPNVIDSFSHQAFFSDKYSDQYPAIRIMIYKDPKGYRFFILDNGVGHRFFKPHNTPEIEKLRLRGEYPEPDSPYYLGGRGLGIRLTYASDYRLHEYGSVAIQEGYYSEKKAKILQ